MVIGDFADLVKRVQDGDAEAMERLLKEYGDAIQREIRFHLLDRQLRRVVGESDVFQSVITLFAIKLRDGQYQFDTPNDLIAFLKTMARAHVAHLARFWHARRRNLRKNVGLLDGDINQLRNGEAAGSTVERIELLERVLERLSERDRQILDWRQDKTTWSEIASRLNVPSSEALRRQHERAVARIANEFCPEEFTERHQSMLATSSTTSTTG